MKKVFFLFFLVPALSFGQIGDDFESGNLDKWIRLIPDHWKADTTSSVSGNYSLHHSFDNPQAGYDQAEISLEDIRPLKGVTTWSFKIRYGYNPSSSNNWSIFLMADCEPSSMMPNGNVSGFAVGVNLSGYDDTLRLWKIKNGSVTKVLSCGINWEKDIGINSIASITVERSPSGEWKISVLKGSLQPGWIVNGTDKELFSPRWFGIYYKYTSTADRLLWVDDVKINGVFFTDTVPPQPDTSYINGKNKIIISFDETPDISRLSSENFVLNPGGFIASEFKAISDLSLEISFGVNFKNKSENEIVIKNLCDSIHNCTGDERIFFTPVWAECGDVIITEIMADPVPAVGLPEKEYIEITNSAGFDFNLKGWNLASGSSATWFPEKIIKQNGIIILCSISDTSLFKSFGSVIGLKPFPSLTDQGKMLTINNAYGDMIHGIEYSSDWYGDVLKSEGGWSLEMEDTGFPFYYNGNWASSVSRLGGTPGSKNSVSGINSDKSCPVILNVYPYDSTSVFVRFDEPVIIEEGMISGIRINDISIESFKPTDPLFREYCLVTGQTLKTKNRYKITFPEKVTDFSGNPLSIKEYVFGVPEPAVNGEIQFNELLFNPYLEATDYIEFYNCSDKVIDAATLKLISVSDATSDTSEYVMVSDEHRCIMPYSYYVITTDKKEVVNRYISAESNSIFEVGKLISMADDKGHLVLLNKELDVIDEVWYDEKMHFILLSDYEGVAIEKIRPCMFSGNRENWHSAAESSGWGTPGTSNSVYTSDPINEDGVTFSSTKITPDNDGFEDLLIIDLRFKNEGNVITAAVFGDSGNYIKELANNLSVGINDSLVWDGTDNEGSLVSTGIYIIYFSGFDETGKITRWKKVCTVIRR